MAQIKTTSGIQISFDDKKENVIRENLQALILSIRSGNLFAGFHVSPSLLWISSNLNISGIEDENVIADIAFSAGVSIQGDKEIELPSFFEAIGEKAQEYLNRPVQEYHLVFPLNYKRDKLLIDCFSINRLDFEVKSWSEISNKYDIVLLQETVRGFIHYPHAPVYWHEQSTPLCIRIYGRSHEEVFRRAETAYDILITSINYILDTSLEYQFAIKMPLASILPAVGYGVFLPSGNFEAAFIGADLLNFQRLCENALDLIRLQALIKLAESDYQIDRRLFQALRSYNEGLETARWDISFLSYWRVFEILAFGNRTNYDMDDVVKRISILLNAGNIEKGFLNLCASRRNNLVHRGVFPSEEQPLDLTLKMFSNLSLSKFDKLIQKYRTEQMIEYYFNLSGINSDLLREQGRIIENILNERSH